MTVNKTGKFGQFGGQYVAESLMPLLIELEEAYAAAVIDPEFFEELDYYNKHYIGRPSPLYFAERLTNYLGGARIYFKRDELNHSGAHKINNCMGQILLAKRMGKNRIIAETGAGQHGVATSTVCTLFNKNCVVYMGAKDLLRQEANVFRMKLLGAEVKSVEHGQRGLKEAMNEAMRDWVSNAFETYYLIGTAAGPHPYPSMVRDFQSIIGREVSWQLEEQEGKGVKPDYLIASIGGGSNAIGLFHHFIPEKKVNLIAVEAAGKGLNTDYHAASINKGRPGVLHGNLSYYLQDNDGQIIDSYSISAGLDYPGIGPEHSHLHDIGRAKYESATDDDALNAVKLCAKYEGIIAALEPAHALAYTIKLAPNLPKDKIIVVNVCGRGDKDLPTLMKHLAS